MSVLNLAIINFDQTVYFSEGLLRCFQCISLQKMKFRDIFNVFFIPSVVRVKKYIKKCWEICRMYVWWKIVNKSRKQEKLIARAIFISASQDSKQMYIGNFVYLLVTMNIFNNPFGSKALWILGTYGLSRSILGTCVYSRQAQGKKIVN